MAFDFYPAVDENYNFPQVVREALAASQELHSLVIPMTTTDRNNLVGAQLWDGRLILNTTTGRINRYSLADDHWSVVAEESDSILYFTEVQRDNLTGPDLWDNRLILNTTTNHINRYDSVSGLWIPILDPSDLHYIEVLTDTVVPLFTIIGGDIGSADEAARADHRHPSPAAPELAVFTASGIWTKPAGATKVEVFVWGAGGGGAACGAYVGGGGGGGACVNYTFDAASLGATEVVTIGAGGLGQTGNNGDGQPGGNSSFGSYITANGGGPGDFATSPQSTLISPGGKIGPIAEYFHGGGDGDGSYSTTVIRYMDSILGGAGGGKASNGSFTLGGNSVAGGKGGDGSSSTTGSAGVAPGGGGGGGNKGGNGARGEVRVYTHF